MVAFSVQVPEWVAKFYKKKAKARLISKAAAVRQVLVDHAEKAKDNGEIAITE